MTPIELSLFASRLDAVCEEVVNRAHHADIGGSTPGSMPVSRSLHDEGQVIPPRHLVRGGTLDEVWLEQLLAATNPADHARGDFLAQVSANRAGVARLGEMADGQGRASFEAGLEELNAYGERLARQSLAALPVGVYRFADWIDDDGQGAHDIPLQLTIEISDAGFGVDFAGTASQVAGNINCPLAVTAAAVFYAFRCFMPGHTPACAGSLRPIRLSAPAGSVLNARYPAAVAAGNVETSSRVVDLVLGALAQAVPMRIPAASQGTMNNLAMGSSGSSPAWAYYETIGGGMGAGAHGGGWSGVQTHMTNTLNTPIEVLETRYPLRVRQYSLRPSSGGRGQRHGGDGLVRELELLAPAQATLLTERRHRGPWGAAGGGHGRPGRNLVNEKPVPPKVTMTLAPGDRLRIETPGGGGWGELRAPVDDDPAVESRDARPSSTRTEL
jgi:N-methylhydantoinase B